MWMFNLLFYYFQRVMDYLIYFMCNYMEKIKRKQFDINFSVGW